MGGRGPSRSWPPRPLRLSGRDAGDFEAKSLLETSGASGPPRSAAHAWGPVSAPSREPRGGRCGGGGSRWWGRRAGAGGQAAGGGLPRAGSTLQPTPALPPRWEPRRFSRSDQGERPPRSDGAGQASPCSVCSSSGAGQTLGRRPPDPSATPIPPPSEAQAAGPGGSAPGRCWPRTHRPAWPRDAGPRASGLAGGRGPEDPARALAATRARWAPAGPGSPAGEGDPGGSLLWSPLAPLRERSGRSRPPAWLRGDPLSCPVLSSGRTPLAPGGPRAARG